jgi:Tol biopolymer transport system component
MRRQASGAAAGRARRLAVSVVILLGAFPVIRPAPASANPSGADDIYVENSNGVARKPVVTGLGDDEFPSWSPGGRIAFSSNRDGDYDIYVVNSDGGGLTQVSNDPGMDTTPAYSPDGRRIAFASDRAGSLDIWVMNEDGSGLRAVTHDGKRDTEPTWSPDGSRIAFTGYDGGGVNIWVVNADGTGQAQLTKGSTDAGPDWSADGQRLAFGSGPTGVTTIKPDGSDVRSLAPGSQPAWSSGGARIVYVRVDPPNYTAKLRVVSADGSQDAPFGDQTGDSSTPAWSVGGGQVAFTYHA